MPDYNTETIKALESLFEQFGDNDTMENLCQEIMQFDIGTYDNLGELARFLRREYVDSRTAGSKRPDLSRVDWPLADQFYSLEKNRRTYAQFCPFLAQYAAMYLTPSSDILVAGGNPQPRHLAALVRYMAPEDSSNSTRRKRKYRQYYPIKDPLIRRLPEIGEVFQLLELQSIQPFLPLDNQLSKSAKTWAQHVDQEPVLPSGLRVTIMSGVCTKTLVRRLPPSEHLKCPHLRQYCQPMPYWPSPEPPLTNSDPVIENIYIVHLDLNSEDPLQLKAQERYVASGGIARLDEIANPVRINGVPADGCRTQ